MNILSVSTLPPHPGGSAVSCALLLGGFAAAGHSVRVLSPLAADSAGGDAFAAAHPRIEVTRFAVPFAELSSIFVKLAGPLSVEYIIVKGRDPATGQAIEEKIAR